MPPAVMELEPIPRAPENVFILRNKEVCPGGWVPKVHADGRRDDDVTLVLWSQGQQIGWRNTFQLPVSYDVELIPGLLDLQNDSLAVRHIPADVARRRFIVIGESMSLAGGTGPVGRGGWR
jgi:hypothetical protein